MPAPRASNLMTGASEVPASLPRACSWPRAPSASSARLSASSEKSRSSVRAAPSCPSMARVVVPARKRKLSKVQFSPCSTTRPLPEAELPRSFPRSSLNAKSSVPSAPNGAPRAFMLKSSAPSKPGRSVAGLSAVTSPASAQLSCGFQRASPASCARPPKAPRSSWSMAIWSLCRAPRRATVIGSTRGTYRSPLAVMAYGHRPASV